MENTLIKTNLSPEVLIEDIKGKVDFLEELVRSKNKEILSLKSIIIETKESIQKYTNEIDAARTALMAIVRGGV